MKLHGSFIKKGLFIPAIILFTGCSPNWDIINPYENEKPFPYKASLHNHSHYHPEWGHAPHPSDKRLLDYRDYDTEPEYGIVSITEHERVTTPWNTIPSGLVEENEAPWGVEGILWIPGNETIIGYRERDDWRDDWVYHGGIFGEVLVINASTEQTNEINWAKYQHPFTRSGLLYQSDYSHETNRSGLPASVEIDFSGVGFRWFACKEPDGGIAGVYLNEKKVGETNLYSSAEICNQQVFALEDLENKMHSLKIVYERKGDTERRWFGRINMDMLTVIKADGREVDYGADHKKLSYQPYKYEHVAHPKGKGHGVEEPLRMLSQDGCFLVLAHPNSRLVTEGEHKGTQLWTSAGFTYDELDILFGNKEKGIPSVSHPPHALEIGNRGYDFSERTGYRNAEEKWDYLLSQGHRLNGIASDDSHGTTPFEGWTVVYTNAETREDLTLEDVMESLFAGNFYASQGPNMHIEVENNQFTITADQPALIEFISKGEVVHHKGNTLTATYTIQGDEVYVRGRVTREDSKWRYIGGGGIGHRRSAWTNPIYVVRH